MNGPDTDERLRAALRHAPDAGLAPPPELDARILAAARRAAGERPAAPAPTPARPRRAGWLSGWSGWQLGASGAFASVLMAGVIGLLWQDGVPPAVVAEGSAPMAGTTARPTLPAPAPLAPAPVPPQAAGEAPPPAPTNDAPRAKTAGDGADATAVAGGNPVVRRAPAAGGEAAPADGPAPPQPPAPAIDQRPAAPSGSPPTLARAAPAAAPAPVAPLATASPDTRTEAPLAALPPLPTPAAAPAAPPPAATMPEAHRPALLGAQRLHADKSAAERAAPRSAGLATGPATGAAAAPVLRDPDASIGVALPDDLQWRLDGRLHSAPPGWLMQMQLATRAQGAWQAAPGARPVAGEQEVSWSSGGQVLGRLWLGRGRVLWCTPENHCEQAALSPQAARELLGRLVPQ